MFGSLKNKIDLLAQEKENFILVLDKIIGKLISSNNLAQSEIILNLIGYLKSDNYTIFIKSINGIDLWGGSGAVWEVYIENKEDAEIFEKEMIDLIDLMEKTKIMGNRIIPIRKLFQENQKK